MADEKPREMTLADKAQKHVGTLGFLALLAYMNPIKVWLYTHDQGVAIEQRVTKVEHAQDEIPKVIDEKIQGLRTEMSSNGDRILQRMTEVSQRLIDNVESKNTATNKRIDNLEESIDRKLELLLKVKR